MTDNAVPNGDCTPSLVTELRAIHDDMTDEGMCPYYRRGEVGQDPDGICSFGCRDEPACQTCWEPPGWPSERLRDLIARVEQVGWEWQYHPEFQRRNPAVPQGWYPHVDQHGRWLPEPGSPARLRRAVFTASPSAKPSERSTDA